MRNSNYVSMILWLSIYNVSFRNYWVLVLPGFAKEKNIMPSDTMAGLTLLHNLEVSTRCMSYLITCIIHRTIINDSGDFWIIWFLEPDSNVRWSITQRISRIVEASKVARSCNGEIITLLLRKTNEHTPVNKEVHVRLMALAWPGYYFLYLLS